MNGVPVTTSDAGGQMDVRSAALQMAAQYLSAGGQGFSLQVSGANSAADPTKDTFGWYQSAVMDAGTVGLGGEVPQSTSVSLDTTAQHHIRNVNSTGMDASSAAAASLVGLVHSLPQLQGIVCPGAGLDLLHAVRAVGSNSAASESQAGVLFSHNLTVIFTRVVPLTYIQVVCDFVYHRWRLVT